MSFAMSYEEMRALLEKSLKESRYQHSLGVAETALLLAQRFGINEEQAQVAGLLHDCAREFPNGELLHEAEKRQIAVEPIERQMPLLLHAYVGARLVVEKYGVQDREVEQAIWRHTVGGAAMTPLDKIIWFADMIEPNRDYPGVEKLRELAQTASLDDMLLAGFTQSIAFVLQKGGLIHPDTVIARNEILLKR
ncbi:MAG: bis(5'-nucleosyl)-tetraphosphatase (symmetrical) YqeK [Selenomonas sp.]|uniref:bis(5'-nucleosyl)-tetraphosphatase (symmetrical) YqeK n=1 Tax=Selenomonas sp. TaxID=2053611 RepID=UPI0025E3A496|nr:bis(5'-nucleosyl)-tetraphosphatase (symmetrical) YqeK [Selenomonas sp.]MCR5757521.1 bis(5'-nucleosyl)-tetraphosphatase (symmetrical) YqeK [Selenomonas sp.]